MSNSLDNDPLDAGLIAVVGMACQFPGASDVDQYWHNLKSGKESIQRFTREELLAAGELPEMLAHPDYVPAQPTLDGFDQFDAKFWGFSPRDAAVTDPAHRLFLEVGYHALEHAGHRGLEEEGTVAVFASSGASLYWMQNLASNPDLMERMGEFLVRHTGNDMNFLATRLSYELDLRGPSMNVQTACSSSLVAIHYAAASLLAEECDIALAGASNVLLPQGRGYLYKQGEIMSPDGHCRPFDVDSAGTVFGSGAGAVVLRRLADAQAEGDNILAVVRGSAVNNDGSQKVGYLAPGVQGQAAAITEAQAIAGIEPSEVSYVEAHGTGTLVGDPIEIEALKQAFGPASHPEHRCLVGSVKSNIGHLGEAAGMASFIKAVLCLQHRQIPTTPNFQTPNPDMDIDDSPFEISARLHDWHPISGQRICGVTALGAGGTNAHVVLAQAPEASVPRRHSARAVPVLLSARSKESLSAAATQLSDYLSTHPQASLEDVAFTLSVGRRSYAHRASFVANSHDDAIAQLDHLSTGSGLRTALADGTAPLLFMFPGGGAQYPGMGAELYQAEPMYAAAMDACLAVLDAVDSMAMRRLLLETSGPDDINWSAMTRELEQPSRSLIALFATEYAMARLLLHWGVRPDALIGHSMGEYTAACIADVMSLSDTVRLVQKRGQLFEQVAAGAMLSVSLAPEKLERRLPDGLSIAAINAPELCVASGDVALIEALERALGADDIECTRVHINVAAHSAMLETIIRPFRDFCSTITLSPPSVPLASNLTGGWMSDEQATSPDYWTDHLRSTVRFADNVATVQSLGTAVFLEVGPGRTLVSLARACGVGIEQTASSMRHVSETLDDTAAALAALTSVWSAGGDVDWQVFWADEQRLRVALPGYAFQRQRYWVAPGPVGVQEDIAPVMSKRDDIGEWFGMLAWRQTGFPQPLADSVPTWLVFAPNDRSMGPVSHWLPPASSSTEPDVITVTREPGQFRELSSNHYQLDPSDPVQFHRLLDVLTGAGLSITDIVYAWSMDSQSRAATPGQPPTLPELDAGLMESFWLPFRLAKSLCDFETDAATPVNLTFVTQNLWAFEDHPGDPLMAPLMGAVQVIPRELPHLQVRSIDLQAANTAALQSMLQRELGGPCTDAQVLLRDGQRWARQIESAYEPSVVDRSAPAWVKPQGTYLLSGGLGGIGLTVAEHLARQGASRLLLLSRSGLTDVSGIERQSSALARIASYGASVHVLVADVGSQQAVAEALQQQGLAPEQIDGVFHAAGAMDDQLLMVKSEASAQQVLDAKVRGALVLDSMFAAVPLDFMVFFSSIASYLGLPGQIDYSAANAFLDSLAAHRSRRCSGFTGVINWNAWRDVGMAASASQRVLPVARESNSLHPAIFSHTRADGGVHQFDGALSTADHWFVREHQVRGGPALISGTGLLEIAALGLAQLFSDRALKLSLDDVQFIEAVHVESESPREFTLIVSPHTSATYELSIHTGSPDAPHFIATGRRLAHAGSHEAVEPIRARCTQRVSTDGRFLHQQLMDFGPRWSCIDAINVNLGGGEALLDLSLADPLHTDLAAHPLHPALLDMAIGAAQCLIPDFEPATDFFVPFGYQAFKVFAPLPAALISHVRLGVDPANAFACFDVTMMDPQGNVLVEVERFTMKRVAADSTFSSGRPPPAASSYLGVGLDDILKHAITPKEGVDALDRLMRQQTRSQWVVSSVDTADWLDVLAQPPKSNAARTFVQTADEVNPDAHPLIPAAEAALHALAPVDAVAVRCFSGASGTTRATAFVVPAAPAPTPIRQWLNNQLQQAGVGLSLDAVLIRDTLARDAEGEIVRAQLLDPLDDRGELQAPSNATESQLLTLWAEVLGSGALGVDDHFFELGGHSLLLTRLIAKVQKAFGRKLPLEQAYETPTIRAWGALLDAEASEPTVALGIGRANRDQFKL